MSRLKRFRNKDTNEVISYPAHFENHPVFGLNLEPFDDECEVDKVVVESKELPVEQRISNVAKPDAEPEAETPKKPTSKKRD